MSVIGVISFHEGNLKGKTTCTVDVTVSSCGTEVRGLFFTVSVFHLSLGKLKSKRHLKNNKSSVEFGTPRCRSLSDKKRKRTAKIVS